MDSDEYSPEEAALRRDEVIRRMADTPPQHRSTRPRKEAKQAASDRGRVKRGVDRRAKP